MVKDIQEMKETKGEDSYVYIPFSISLTFLNPTFLYPFFYGHFINFPKSTFLYHFSTGISITFLNSHFFIPFSTGISLTFLYGNNRTPAHSFPARNDKLVIPESFWPEQGWSERIRALAFRHELFIQMSFWFRPA